MSLLTCIPGRCWKKRDVHRLPTDKPKRSRRCMCAHNESLQEPDTQLSSALPYVVMLRGSAG